MSDVSGLIHGPRAGQDGALVSLDRRGPASATPPGRSTESSPGQDAGRSGAAGSSVGPFDRLLRELQQAARPIASRMNERAASGMFDSASDNETGPRLDADGESASLQGPGSHAARTSDTARSRGNSPPADRRESLESGHRVVSASRSDAVERRGNSFDTPVRSSDDARSSSQRSAPSGVQASGAPAARAFASEQAPGTRGLPAVDGPKTSERSNAAPPLQGSVGSPEIRTIVDPIGVTEDMRGSDPAAKLVLVLAELSADEAETLQPGSDAFRSVLTRASQKQDRAEISPRSDGTRDAANLRSDSGADRTNGASPLDPFLRALRIRGGESRSSATLRLHPPELGSLTVHVRSNGDRIRIAVRAESAEAVRRLQSRVAQLETALRQNGLSVDALTVDSIDAAPSAGADMRAIAPASPRPDGEGERGPRSTRGADARLQASVESTESHRLPLGPPPLGADRRENRASIEQRLSLDA